MFIYSAHANSAPVYAWTVDSRPWMKWAFWAGLDGVVTGDVGAYKEVVGEEESLGAGERAGRGSVGVWKSIWLSGAHLLAAVVVAAYTVIGGGRHVRKTPRRGGKGWRRLVGGG